MSIAFDYLTDIEKAQLLHFRPDLRHGYLACKRCLNGQVFDNVCLQCGAEHDGNGELPTVPAYPDIIKHKGGRRNKWGG